LLSTNSFSVYPRDTVRLSCGGLPPAWICRVKAGFGLQTRSALLLSGRSFSALPRDDNRHTRGPSHSVLSY